MQEKLPDPSLKRIMRLNAPEWGWIVFGCICAIIMGAVQPAFAIVFADVIGVGTLYLLLKCTYMLAIKLLGYGV